MTLIIFILGLIAGSFVSAVTYRIVRGEDFVNGRSKCPKCKNIIAWYDNIPLFSYLFLKGKCRNCVKKISIRYPLIEFLTATVFTSVYLTSHTGENNLNVLYLFFVAILLITILVVDWEHMIIPDPIIFTLIVFAWLNLIIVNENIYIHLFSGLAASLFLLILHLITLGRGMGLGDVKLAIFGGMFFGFPETVVWIFTSFIIGGIVGVILLLFGKAKLGRPIPFGPFLIAAFFATLLWGDKLNNWYFPGF